MFIIIGKNWVVRKKNNCKYFEYCLLFRDGLQSLNDGRTMRLDISIIIKTMNASDTILSV